MGLITDVWDTTVMYKGRWYRTRAAYDIVLATQKLYKDEELSDYDKTTQALKMLLCRPFLVKMMVPAYRIGLLEEIFNQQIRTEPHKQAPAAQTRTVDFELDGDFIYAAFMQDYGIDLIEQQGKLHWKKFLALFKGLSDDTRIKQIMQIRSMEEPKPTRYNQEQIQKIRELKAFYALPVRDGAGSCELDSLFSALERLAE